MSELVEYYVAFTTLQSMLITVHVKFNCCPFVPYSPTIHEETPDHRSRNKYKGQKTHKNITPTLEKDPLETMH